LEDEFLAIINFKMAFHKRHPNLSPPPTFGGFLDQSSCPMVIKEKGYQMFNRTVYRKQYRENQEDLCDRFKGEFEHIITPHYSKKVFLSNSCKGMGDLLLSQRMNVIGNKLRKVVNERYIVDQEFGQRLNPIKLRDNWNDILRFEEAYDYYRQILQNQDLEGIRKCA
jgi:hypothetical protein